MSIFPQIGQNDNFFTIICCPIRDPCDPCVLTRWFCVACSRIILVCIEVSSSYYSNLVTTLPGPNSSSQFFSINKMSHSPITAMPDRVPRLCPR